MNTRFSVLRTRCAVVSSMLWLLAGCLGGHAPSEDGALCDSDHPIDLVIQQGNHQVARPGDTLVPLTVRLRCTRELDGLPPTLQTIDITDDEIQWRVAAGGGTLSAASTTTNVDGFASVTWTLGPDLGPAAVEASYARAGAGRDQTITARFDATAAYPSACAASGGTDHGGYAAIDVDTTWRAADGPHRGLLVVIAAGATLTVEPGAVVCVQGISSPHDGAVVAEGTADAPILFSVHQPATQAWQGMPVRSLRHAVVENAAVVQSAPGVATVIEDTTFVRRVAPSPLQCSQVFVFVSQGAGRIVRTTIDGHGGANCAALHAAAGFGATLQVQARVTNSHGDGVLLGGSGSVAMASCTLHGNARHGAYVFAPGNPPSNPERVSINGCNFGPNGGDAIHSEATTPVDATGNWWGDAGGPFGGSAGGLTGLIDAGGWLTAPAVLGY